MEQHDSENINEKGIKTVVEYKQEGTKLLKITQQYKTTTNKVNKNIVERMKWKSFGEALHNPNSAQVIISEECKIQIPSNESENNKIVDKIIKNLTLRKHTRSLENNTELNKIEPKLESVSKSKRNQDANTLKVTNLSEDALEKDIYDLFKSFGQINRVNIIKHHDTGLSKGFAFVSFFNRKDAENAKKYLHGYGYDHLILNVELIE